MNEITTRRIPFEFPDDIDPYWKPDMPEWSAYLNGLSLTMPYLEPFLIRTIQEARQSIGDPRLKKDIQSFIQQEAQHFAQHRKFNELMKAKGYPELAVLEDAMEKSYQTLDQASLQKRMAYTAGFETMTIALTQFLVGRRRWLFKDADPRVASLMLWHIVEEAEHKRVAIDAYRAACPGYFARLVGIFHGSFDVMINAAKGARIILRKDDRFRLTNKLRLAMIGLSFFVTWIPLLMRSMLPRFHPDSIQEPQWVHDWIREYESAEGIPLLDTSHPDIPPRFA